MTMNLKDITPAIFCKNEEYWIHYVLRDLLQVFDRVVMLDTGSEDATKEIACKTAEHINGKFDLIEQFFGDDPHKIGECPNILRNEVKTFWMLLLAGDEVLRIDQLLKLKDIELDTTKYLVGMILGYNVRCVAGKLVYGQDKFCADKFFAPGVYWTATEYPFEGYGQHLLAEQGLIGYLPQDFYYWHVRHLQRSKFDETTYFRKTKIGYYPYDGPFVDMPADWLGEIASFPNPHLDR